VLFRDNGPLPATFETKLREGGRDRIEIPRTASNRPIAIPIIMGIFTISLLSIAEVLFKQRVRLIGSNLHINSVLETLFVVWDRQP
jgi:hypothetical protein